MPQPAIKLPHGCSCSKINVYPANWKSVRASLKKPWYISFRFYDPAFRNDPKYKKGKFVVVKGMNDLMALRARQLDTEAKVTNLTHMLVVEGYNPITGRSVAPIETTAIVDPYTPLLLALRTIAKDLTRCSDSVQRDIRSMLGFVATAAGQLGISELPVSHTSRKHIKAILKQIEINRKPESPHRFNKNRSYLMMLFHELMEYEAIENDPVVGVAKKEIPEKIRPVMNLEERRKVDAYLKANYYTFWRYMHIFFQSGARITEMMRLQVKDVDLPNQVFKLTIKKGNKTREVLKPINDLVVPLWTDLLADAVDTDFVFSKGLVPGPAPIKSYQITKRWSRLVKEKDNGLNINATFYPLKHLSLDQVAELLTIDDAQSLADHQSKEVTMKFYAQGEKMRQLEKLKRVPNTFAPILPDAGHAAEG